MNYVEREKLYKELKETNKENTAGKNVVPSPAKASQKSPQKASEGGQTGRGRQQKPQNIAVTQSQQVSLARDVLNQDEDEEATILVEGKKKKQKKNKGKKGGVKA